MCGVPVQHRLRACHCFAIEQSFAHSPVVCVIRLVPSNFRENIEIFLDIKSWRELFCGKDVRRKDEDNPRCVHRHRLMGRCVCGCLLRLRNQTRCVLESRGPVKVKRVRVVLDHPHV